MFKLRCVPAGDVIRQGNLLLTPQDVDSWLGIESKWNDCMPALCVFHHIYANIDLPSRDDCHEALSIEQHQL